MTDSPRLSTRRVYTGRVLNLDIDTVRFPNGTTGELEMIRPWNSRFPQTSIVRLEYTRGWDLDPEVQFFADGETGLRAYRLHAFEGDQRLILNVEHRFFLGRELFHVFSPGAAVFFDAGNALPGDVPFDLSSLKTDAGIGLRLGLSKTPKNVLRVDFGWAFDSDPLGRSGFLMSVSMSQAF